MANTLKCDLCSKPATVHLTQIVNNKVHKVDLCEACAQEKGVTDPQGFSLADLLLKAAGETVEATDSPSGRCPSCGFSQNDFKKHGRFGCPQCYETFSTLVEPMLENMHKGTSHAGKVPARALDRRALEKRIADLESQLDNAIRAERYEDAARLRDEIAETKSTCDAKFAR
ncbi:UvrB/UvrC motif-containing protein [Nibricoccus sp. IMCC34717]|uniref:UvrB/UvrC motif-containing protein n=1 Tax=Nibricoccus sp. IMCC34717 TaxID=3034021 RepID=UPI00384E3437